MAPYECDASSLLLNACIPTHATRIVFTCLYVVKFDFEESHTKISDLQSSKYYYNIIYKLQSFSRMQCNAIRFPKIWKIFLDISYLALKKNFQTLKLLILKMGANTHFYLCSLYFQLYYLFKGIKTLKF